MMLNCSIFCSFSLNFDHAKTICFIIFNKCEKMYWFLITKIKNIDFSLKNMPIMMEKHEKTAKNHFLKKLKSRYFRTLQKFLPKILAIDTNLSEVYVRNFWRVTEISNMPLKFFWPPPLNSCLRGGRLNLADKEWDVLDENEKKTKLLKKVKENKKWQNFYIFLIDGDLLVEAEYRNW